MPFAEGSSVLEVLASLLPKRGSRLRVAMLCSLLLLGAGLFAKFVDPFYPMREWLFFHYTTAWLLAGFFMLASLASGLRVLDYLLPNSLLLGERLTLGLALGVLIFFWGVFLAGLLGLYGIVFFYAWPVLLLAVGGQRLGRIATRSRVHLARFGIRLFMPKTPVQVLAALLIILSLAALYLAVMIPMNIGADANSYHIPIAEHYAAAGRIGPFADGWYAGAYPQLTSVLYTWAMLAPGDYADHIALCSHLEWALFLATLGSVAVLAGRLAGRLRLPFASAAIFLFPGIYLYDSSLITQADHVLAFWAPPLALALLRLARVFTFRNAILVGTFAAAAMLTKFTGLLLFAPTALLVLVLAVRARKLPPLLAWGGSALALSSPYWLKNWVYYGDPLYPILYRYFPDHPWHEGAGSLLGAVFTPQFEATGSALEKLLNTLKTLATFSLVPNDWGGFHDDKPVFGSLFTLLVPVLIFLRPPRRLWVTVVGAHIGVAVWFLTNHQDRYLQALLPWMAACVAATLALAWQYGPLVRGALIALVGLQLVWGSDVYFFRTHAMVHDSPIRGVGEFLGAGHRKQYNERFDLPGTLFQVGNTLPRGAKLLIHGVDEKLGARAQTLIDVPGRQGAIDYLLLESPQAVASMWRKLGVTHVVWIPNWGAGGDDLAREAVFARTIHQRVNDSQQVADWRVASVTESPKDALLDAAPTKLAWLLCNEEPSFGIYSTRGLHSRTAEAVLTEEALAASPLDALATANAVLLRRSCSNLTTAFAAIPEEFESVTRPGDRELWVRTRPHGHP